MEGQTKSALFVQFFLGSVTLLNGLLTFETASLYRGSEHNFAAENWGIPFAIFRALVFCAGWWFESIIEKTILFKGKKTAFLATIGFLLMAFTTIIGSLFFIPLGFFRFAISSTGYILVSGFFFHLSAARPDVIAKLQLRS